MRRGAVMLALAGALSLGLPAAQTAPALAVSPVEQLVGSCPTAAEVGQIGGEFTLSFEGDPTAGALVCTAASGSADLTRLQERAYQALRVIRRLTFQRSLPWTSLGLYDWLVATIDGIRFRSDIDVSFCCDPARVVNIQTRNLAALLTSRWLDPRSAYGLDGLVGLFVHEARHVETGGHTCGSGDRSIRELGAWGTQYYLFLFMALYSGSFLDAADQWVGYYREAAFQKADAARGRVCALPSADLAIGIADRPDPVATGRLLVYTATVRNGGPDYAPNAFFYLELPEGATFHSASASQGSCAAEAGSASGPVGCALGEMPVGRSATVTVSLRVTSTTGRIQLVKSLVTADVVDSVRSNDSATAETEVATTPPPPPPPPPGCPGAPGRGGRSIVGTSGNDRLVGTKGPDVICGLGGSDTIEGKGGEDTLFGGAGTDTLLARDGRRDVVDGGAGRDRARVDRADAVRGVEIRLP